MILTDGSNPTRKFCYFGEELWLEIAGSSRDRYITHHPLMNGYLGVHKASPGPSYLCFNDARMNRLAVVNPAGNIVQYYNYDTFGVQSGTPPSVLEPVFGGMRYLASKGVFLSRSRLYKPEHGMFLSADPLGYIDSQNLYAYVAHNPANFVDPFGWSKGEGPAEFEANSFDLRQSAEDIVTDGGTLFGSNSIKGTLASNGGKKNKKKQPPKRDQSGSKEPRPGTGPYGLASIC